MSVANRSFGPYQLVRRLGMGGMAETFEAVRLGPGGFEQRVCVKRILPTFEQDQQFVRLFLEEARLAARLRHANIVQVIDFGVADGSHYLALELVQGCDLRELLRGERARAAAAPGGPPAGLTSGLVAFIAQEIALALEVAHGGAEAIVHRDISPSNVLLSTAGEVKLSDFGIARAIGNHQATATSTVKGKVPYMAPEYALRGHVDRRVDLFALGVLLYECLAGARPFDGTSELDTLANIESGTHIALRERCPTAPRALVDTIEKLLLPNPDHRIQSAAAVLDALVDVAPPPTARRILAEFVTRTRAARPGGDVQWTAVDALANTSIAPKPGATPPGTSPRLTAVEPDASSAAVGENASVAAQPSATDAGSARQGSGTAVLTAASRDGRAAPPLPFASAGSAEVTRTVAPAERVADAETRAGQTRTIVDPASAIGDAETRLLPRVESPDASVEPTSGGTFDPPAPRALTPSEPKRRAPLGLILLGSVALLGSASLALFLVLGWHSAPPTPAVTPTLPTPTLPIAVTPEHTSDNTVSAETRRADRTKRHDARLAAAAAGDEENLTTRALLSVVSERGGDIYIDGRRAGASPASITVPPGRHVLANGSNEDAASLTIDIGRGERRRVVLH